MPPMDGETPIGKATTMNAEPQVQSVILSDYNPESKKRPRGSTHSWIPNGIQIDILAKSTNETAFRVAWYDPERRERITGYVKAANTQDVKFFSQDKPKQKAMPRALPSRYSQRPSTTAITDNDTPTNGTTHDVLLGSSLRKVSDRRLQLTNSSTGSLYTPGSRHRQRNFAD